MLMLMSACVLQAVFVPSTFSGEPRDFYLGVVHAESNRAYQNYFYKMQVCVCVWLSVSAPLRWIHLQQ